MYSGVISAGCGPSELIHAQTSLVKSRAEGIDLLLGEQPGRRMSLCGLEKGQQV